MERANSSATHVYCSVQTTHSHPSLRVFAELQTAACVSGNWHAIPSYRVDGPGGSRSLPTTVYQRNQPRCHGGSILSERQIRGLTGGSRSTAPIPAERRAERNGNQILFTLQRQSYSAGTKRNNARRSNPRMAFANARSPQDVYSSAAARVPPAV